MIFNACRLLRAVCVLFAFVQLISAGWQADINSEQARLRILGNSPRLTPLGQVLLEKKAFYNYFFEFEAVGFLDVSNPGQQSPEFILLYEYEGTHAENRTAAALQTQFVLFTPLREDPLFLNATDFADDTLLDVESDRDHTFFLASSRILPNTTLTDGQPRAEVFLTYIGVSSTIFANGSSDVQLLKLNATLWRDPWPHEPVFTYYGETHGTTGHNNGAPLVYSGPDINPVRISIDDDNEWSYIFIVANDSLKLVKYSDVTFTTPEWKRLIIPNVYPESWGLNTYYFEGQMAIDIDTSNVWIYFAIDKHKISGFNRLFNSSVPVIDDDQTILMSLSPAGEVLYLEVVRVGPCTALALSDLDVYQNFVVLAGNCQLEANIWKPALYYLRVSPDLPMVKLNSSSIVLRDIDQDDGDIASVLILDDSVLIAGTVGYLLQPDSRLLSSPGQGFVAVLQPSDGALIGITRYGTKGRNSWAYQLERDPTNSTQMWFLASLNGPADPSDEKDPSQYAAVYQLTIKLSYVALPVWAVVLIAVGGSALIAAGVFVFILYVIRRNRGNTQYVSIG